MTSTSRGNAGNAGMKHSFMNKRALAYPAATGAGCGRS